MYINIYIICTKGYTNEHCNVSFICNMSSGCQTIYVGDELTHDCYQRCFFDILTRYCTTRELRYQHTSVNLRVSIDAPTNTLRTREFTRTLHPAYGRFVVTHPSLKVETFTEFTRILLERPPQTIQCRNSWA